MVRLAGEVGLVERQQAVHLLPQPLQFVLPLAQGLVLHGQQLQRGGHRVDGDIGVGAAVDQMQEPQPEETLDGRGGLRLRDAEFPYAALDVDVFAPQGERVHVARRGARLWDVRQIRYAVEAHGSSPPRNRA